MGQESKHDGEQRNDNRPCFVHTNPYLVQIILSLLKTPSNAIAVMSLNGIMVQGSPFELISHVQGMIYAEACLAGLDGPVNEGK